MMATNCVSLMSDAEANQSPAIPVQDTPDPGNNQEPDQDYDFVEEPDQDCFCPVSLELLVEPCQTSCCGQHISQQAANRLIEREPCPMCKKIGFTVQVDQYFKRNTINTLKVRCHHKKGGCEWVGELGDLRQHSMSCPKRLWKCQHCDFESTYEIASLVEHTPNCTKYPLPCPNQCEIGTVPRCDAEKHLLVCTLQLVECEFAHIIGCSMKVPRRDMAKHMTEYAVHHVMTATLLNLRLTGELRQKIEEQDKQIADLKQQVADAKGDISTGVTKLQQQTKTIERKLKQHTTDTDTKLHKQTIDIESKLTKAMDTKLQQQTWATQQQTRDIDSKLKQQTRDISQQQTKDIDSKLQGQTAIITAAVSSKVQQVIELQQQVKAIDSKIWHLTKSVDARLQQQSKDIHTMVQQQSEAIDVKHVHSTAVNTKLQQQTKDIGDKLQQHTTAVNTKLQQQTKDIGDKLQQHTTAVNTKLQQQTKDFGGKLQQHTTAVNTKLQQQTKDFGDKLQQHTTAIDTKLQQQTKDMGDKLQQHSSDIRSMLQQQTKALAEAIDSKLQHQTDCVDAKLEVQVKAIDWWLQEQTKDIDTKLQQQAKDFSKLQQQSKDIPAKLQKQIEAIGTKLQRHTTSIDTKIHTKLQQEKDIDIKLREQSECMNTRIQEQTRAINWWIREQTEAVKTTRTQLTRAIERFQEQTEGMDSRLQHQSYEVNTKLQEQARAIIRLQDGIGNALSEQAKHIDQKLSTVESKVGFSRYEFTLTEFGECQKKRNWYSTMFLSSPRGYMFELNIDIPHDAAGHGNKYLKAFLNLLPGDHDQELKWPLQVTVQLDMLNQRGDHDHHTTRRRGIEFNMPTGFKEYECIDQEFCKVTDLLYVRCSERRWPWPVYLTDDGSIQFVLWLQVQ